MRLDINERAEFASWIEATDVDTFGTLKFRNGYDIDERAAERILSIYWNKVDRSYFGKQAIKRGRRVDRLLFRHMGVSGQNLHFHFAARAVGGIDPFCRQLRLLWSESFIETADVGSVVIQPIERKVAVAHYLTHEYGRLAGDTFLPNYSHLSQAHRHP